MLFCSKYADGIVGAYPNCYMGKAISKTGCLFTYNYRQLLKPTPKNSENQNLSYSMSLNSQENSTEKDSS